MIAAWAAAARQQILRRDVFAAEAARGAAAAAENATPSRRLFAALHNRCSVFNANAAAVDSGGATTRDGLRADDAQLGTPHAAIRTRIRLSFV